MFQLTDEEWESLRSQFATSKKGSGGRRYAPLAFTEHGVLMLSSVLNSERAIQVNIQIMRICSKLKGMIMDHRDILPKLEKLEGKVDKDDENFCRSGVWQSRPREGEHLTHPPCNLSKMFRLKNKSFVPLISLASYK